MTATNAPAPSREIAVNSREGGCGGGEQNSGPEWWLVADTMFAMGASIKCIARLNGKTPRAVRLALSPDRRFRDRNRSALRRKDGLGFSAEDIVDTQIAALFLEGLSWREIATRVGLKNSTVRQRAYRMGLRRYTNGNQEKEDPTPRTVMNRRSNKRHREKWRARKAVERALESGRLRRKPCEHCGAVKTQAHHPDYQRPLYVVWLCSTCHAAEHRNAA